MRAAILTTAAALGLGTLAATAPAVADPPQETLLFTCSSGRTLTAAPAPANGTFTPVFDAASTTVFKPTSIQLTLDTYNRTGALTGAETSTEQLGQGHADPGSEITCTAQETITSADDPSIPAGGYRTVSVAATGFFTPRNT